MGQVKEGGGGSCWSMTAATTAPGSSQLRAATLCLILGGLGVPHAQQQGVRRVVVDQPGMCV